MFIIYLLLYQNESNGNLYHTYATLLLLLFLYYINVYPPRLECNVVIEDLNSFYTSPSRSIYGGFLEVKPLYLTGPGQLHWQEPCLPVFWKVR